MASTAETPRPPVFSRKAFGLGLAVVAGFYLLLAGSLWLNAKSTLDRRQQKQASQTVLIEREDFVPAAEPFGPPRPDTTGAAPVQPEPNKIETVATPTSASSNALTRAPIDGLYEDTGDGRLPKIRASDQLTPFSAYRRPFVAVTGKPLISVAVLDLGISDTMAQNAIDSLPPEISVVINPYALNPDYWATESRTAGHEIWLKLPVESSRYPMDDSGPQTLLINALEKQNQNKLNWTLSRTVGYAGIVTGYEPAFMKSPNDTRPVLTTIYRRGLGLVDGDTQPGDIAQNMANAMNAPYAHNNIWVDVPSTTEHVAASLRQLEITAQNTGHAIGLFRPSPMSLQMVSDWAKTLPDKGISLAPLSAQADPGPKP